MIARRHKLFYGLVVGLLLAAVLFNLLVPSSARADVGVQPVLPVGSNLKPEKKTPIQMVSEVVTMRVRQATEADNDLVELNPQAYGYENHPVWFPGIAEVEADFRMKNPTNKAVKLLVWFPLASALEKSWSLNSDETVPRLVSFNVKVEGKPVGITVSELPNPKGKDKPVLPWASFPVTFPPNQNTLIQVSYMLPLQPIPKQTAMLLNYVFQTGAGWDGKIGSAELILNLPYPASHETLAHLPEGAKLSGWQARWKWNNFEPGPQDDFSIWLFNIDTWQGLEAGRAVAQANPQDGMAWLNLGTSYLAVSVNLLSYVRLQFGAAYIPLGIDAYRRAIDCMPDHPAPHAGLALLTLIQYWNNNKQPPEAYQQVLNEYRLAKELDAQNPALLKEAGSSSGILGWLEEALFPYNDATETAYVAFLTASPTGGAATPTLRPSATAADTLSPTMTQPTAKTLTQTHSATTRPSSTATSLATIIPTGTPSINLLPAQSTRLAPTAAPPDKVVGSSPRVKPAQPSDQTQYLTLLFIISTMVLIIAVMLVIKRKLNKR